MGRIDREKVIKGLETCSDAYYGADGACSSCPYSQTNGDRCLAELVYDAIELLKEQEQTPGEWVSVKDRMPDVVYEDRFLIVKKHYEWGTKICITNRYKWKGDTIWEDPGDGWEITHWMPLPEPPKEDEDD